MDARKSPRQLMQELIMLHQCVAELEATVLHQQVEETPQRHAAHFRQVFQWSRQGILVHRCYKPLFANQAFATLYGYAAPDDILSLETVLPLIAPAVPSL
jgi:PAS domain-containing protein